eukprot:jgi/Chrzof1/2629/Cz11g23040.t1
MVSIKPSIHRICQRARITQWPSSGQRTINCQTHIVLARSVFRKAVGEQLRDIPNPMDTMHIEPCRSIGGYGASSSSAAVCKCIHCIPSYPV